MPEESDYQVWFPSSGTVDIAGKAVLIKELTWEEIEACSRYIGTIISEVLAAKRGLAEFASATNASSAALKLFTEVPKVAMKLIEIGTDVPVNVIPKSAAKVVPLLLAAVFEKNEDLKKSFFALGPVLGVKVKVPAK